jgi:hypothetical protein
MTRNSFPISVTTTTTLNPASNIVFLDNTTSITLTLPAQMPCGVTFKIVRPDGVYNNTVTVDSGDPAVNIYYNSTQFSQTFSLDPGHYYEFIMGYGHWYIGNSSNLNTTSSIGIYTASFTENGSVYYFPLEGFEERDICGFMYQYGTTRVITKFIATFVGTPGAVSGVLSLKRASGPTMSSINLNIGSGATQILTGSTITNQPSSSEVIYLHWNGSSGSGGLTSIFVS